MKPAPLHVISERVPPPSKINDAIVVGASVIAGLGAIAFGVGLLADAPMGFYGGALAIGLLAFAYAVRRYYTGRYPDVTATEPRIEPSADADAQAEPLAEIGAVHRRSLLHRALIAAAALFGLSLAAPIASLGPAPAGELVNTAWRRGLRLVTGAGRAVRPDDLPPGGVLTVWPLGAVGDEKSAVLVLRLSDPPRPPTVLEWVVGETVVAYSKICTHAGCPVALFRERDNALFCPCHQSTFDAARGAVPTFGPAARPLPQLPLAVDAEGYLMALSDFRNPVGPPFPGGPF